MFLEFWQNIFFSTSDNVKFKWEYISKIILLGIFMIFDFLLYFFSVYLLKNKLKASTDLTEEIVFFLYHKR